MHSKRTVIIQAFFIVAMFTLVGTPGIWMFIQKVKTSKEVILTFNDKGQLRGQLNGFNINDIPIFNFSTTPVAAKRLGAEVDFSTLSRFSKATYKGNLVEIQDSTEKVKLLYVRRAAGQAFVVGAISEKVLYAFKSPFQNPNKITRKSLREVISDLSVFKSDCFLKLKNDDEFGLICKEINPEIIGMPYKIEYKIQQPDILKFYLTPNNKNIWKEKDIFISPLLLTVGDFSGSAIKNPDNLEMKMEPQFDSEELFLNVKELSRSTVKISYPLK